MRKKLLIPKLCAFSLIFLGASVFGEDNTAPLPAHPTTSGKDTHQASYPTRADSTAEPSQGQMLVRQAEATLQRHYTVSARVKQTAHLFGHEVIGLGEYSEQRSNQGLRFRLELKVRTTNDKQASGLLQICDGRYLWNYRKLRGAESLTCVDSALVQQRLEEQGKQTVQLLDSWPGLGGLPKLMRSFDKAFVFGKPEGVELQDDFPAWKVEGRWRPEMLARAVPEHKEAIEKGRGVALEDLPQHLPNCVVLFLGKEDLFPYSIFYYRLNGKTNEVKASPNDPQMVVITMMNVRFNQAIHAAQFVYKPGLKYEDDTEEMLEKLGLQ